MRKSLPALLFMLASQIGAAHAETYAFAPAPQLNLNRLYRVDRANGEVIACQFGIKSEADIGVTLCYPAGEGAKPGEAGDYALVPSRHNEESGIFRVNKRDGGISICYVRAETEVVCTPPTK